MQFLDLRSMNASLSDEMLASYLRVVASGQTVLGPETEAFESEFAKFCEVKRCVGVGNGLDAITLALKAGGIGPGDEVIVPSHTFIATWLGVTAVGAKPIPVEVNEQSYTIDARAVEAAVGSRTAAIVGVSLYGHPVESDALMSIANKHGLFLLEDAAQAHGAKYKGRRVGSLAHATTFSFYPTKNLGAMGDGGCVVTDDDRLAERLRRLRNYGSNIKYVHDDAGVNSRLDEIQSAFLRVKLPVLDAWNDLRRTIARSYDEKLANKAGFTAPRITCDVHHVYHLYVVRCDDRDMAINSLNASGIASLIHYPVPCHLQKAFTNLGIKRGAFPIAERLANTVLSLPMWPQMEPHLTERVVSSLVGA